jgi:hypothetical protein
MNRINRQAFYGLLAIALACPALAVPQSTDQLSELPKTTHDGRFKTRCHAWGADTSKELCEPSFHRLLAEPEHYHGKMVGLTGFLVEEFGRLVLFPSRQGYEDNVDAEGIEVTGAIERDKNGAVVTHVPSVPDEISAQAGAGGVRPVYVVGTFDAKYTGAGAPRSGAIRLHHMMLSPRISGSESKPAQ